MKIAPFFCYVFPVLFIILFCNATKFIEKLLKKLFSLTKNDEMDRPLTSKNDEKDVAENFKNVKSNTSLKFSGKFYLKRIIICSPMFGFFIYGVFFWFTAVSIQTGNVKRIYSKPYNWYLPYNHVISIKAKAATVNPCNETDNKAFQDFVTLWKERNELQMKLNKWNDIMDTLPTTKSHFSEMIRTAVEKLEIFNVTLEPKFRTYENCFLAEMNKKHNFINLFYFTTLILFNIIFAICCSSSLYFARFDRRFGENIRFGQNFLHYNHISFIIFSCYVNYYLHQEMMENVPEEFVI